MVTRKVGLSNIWPLRLLRGFKGNGTGVDYQAYGVSPRLSKSQSVLHCESSPFLRFGMNERGYPGVHTGSDSHLIHPRDGGIKRTYWENERLNDRTSPACTKPATQNTRARVFGHSHLDSPGGNVAIPS